MGAKIRLVYACHVVVLVTNVHHDVIQVNHGLKIELQIKRSLAQ